MDSVSHFLTVVGSHIPGPVAMSGIVSGFLSEAYMRYTFTQKPLSWIWLIEKGLRASGPIFKQAADVVGKIADFLDQFLPQNVKK